MTTCDCGMWPVEEYGPRCPSCDKAEILAEAERKELARQEQRVRFGNGWSIVPNVFGDAWEVHNRRGTYVATFVFERDARNHAANQV